MKRAIALAVLLPVMACGSWQTTARKSLRVSGTAAFQASNQIDEVCTQVLEQCKAERTNPCPALTRCLVYRQRILTYAAHVITGTVLGYMAVDAGERAKAEKALSEIALLLRQARALLKAVSTPPAPTPEGKKGQSV